MAGCKGGKIIVEIRRSGTKRQQNLNLVKEPLQDRKKMAQRFSCFGDPTMMVHILTGTLQLEVVGPVIAHSFAL